MTYSTMGHRRLLIPLLTLVTVTLVSSELLIAKPLYNPEDGQNTNPNNGGGGPLSSFSLPSPIQAAKTLTDTSMGLFYNPTTRKPNVLMSKPLYDPYGSGSNQRDVREQGGIEIPEIGGIEYYELMNQIRKVTGRARDVAVAVPGNVAGVLQTAWRGSSNLIQQAADHMPEIQLPQISLASLPLAALSRASSKSSSSSTSDSYSLDGEELPPFPYFRMKFKSRPPIESHWLDTYGV